MKLQLSKPAPPEFPLDRLLDAEALAHAELLRALAGGNEKRIKTARRRWADAAEARRVAQELIDNE